MFKQYKLAEDILLPQRLITSQTLDKLETLKGLPFYIWNQEEHLALTEASNGNCCFNHIIGLPTKGNREFPLFDYEQLLYDTLFSNSKVSQTSDEQIRVFKDKHLWVLKATGLGVSELMLRIIGWLCTRDDAFKDSQVVIVTGPNIDLAVGLIKRLKKIFEPRLGVIFEDKETVLNLNGCHIQAYPSNHIDSFRSLSNPKFILLDESDMFRISDQPEVRHVAERYIAKSNPFIVLCSTPGAPGSLMEQIEKESEDKCIYHRIKMDWTYGLGKIYTQEEIEAQKASPSWEREYCLKYAGSLGNVFPIPWIDKAVALGELYSLDKIPVNQYVIHSIGCDPAFGSSKTAIVITEHLKEQGKIRILETHEFERPNPAEIAEFLFNIHRKYWNSIFYVDAANAGFVTELKIKFNENPNYGRAEDISPESNKIIPVNFLGNHKQMLTHLHLLLSKSLLCIPQKHDRLIMSLKSAVANEYSLDKEKSAYNDMLDAMRLSMRGYNMN